MAEAELFAVGGWHFGDRCNGGLRGVNAAGLATRRAAGQAYVPRRAFTGS